MPAAVAGQPFGRVAAYVLHATHACGLLLGYAVVDPEEQDVHPSSKEAVGPDSSAPTAEPVPPFGRAAKRSPGQHCACFPPFHHRLPRAGGVELIFLGSASSASAAVATLSDFHSLRHGRVANVPHRRFSLAEFFSAGNGTEAPEDDEPVLDHGRSILGLYPGGGDGTRPITLLCSSPPQALPFVSFLRVPWLVGTKAEHPVRVRPSCMIPSLPLSAQAWS